MVEKKKLVVSIFGGLLAAFVWYMVIGLLFSSSDIGWLFFVLFIGFTYFLYKRTTRPRHAAGWSSVILALGSFAFPVTVLIWGANQVADAGNQGAAYQLGAGIGATIVSGIGFVFGLFFGVAFAVVAYFLLKTEKSKEEKKK